MIQDKLHKRILKSNHNSYNELRLKWYFLLLQKQDEVVGSKPTICITYQWFSSKKIKIKKRAITTAMVCWHISARETTIFNRTWAAHASFLKQKISAFKKQKWCFCMCIFLHVHFYLYVGIHMFVNLSMHKLSQKREYEINIVSSNQRILAQIISNLKS